MLATEWRLSLKSHKCLTTQSLSRVVKKWGNLGKVEVWDIKWFISGGIPG